MSLPICTNQICWQPNIFVSSVFDTVLVAKKIYTKHNWYDTLFRKKRISIVLIPSLFITRRNLNLLSKLGNNYLDKGYFLGLYCAHICFEGQLYLFIIGDALIFIYLIIEGLIPFMFHTTSVEAMLSFSEFTCRIPF